jgi:hypothetical protein
MKSNSQTNTMLNGKIEKNNIKNNKKKDSSQPNLIGKTLNSSQDIRITL